MVGEQQDDGCAFRHEISWASHDYLGAQEPKDEINVIQPAAIDEAQETRTAC
jgi:hypothetical protein